MKKSELHKTFTRTALSARGLLHAIDALNAVGIKTFPVFRGEDRLVTLRFKAVDGDAAMTLGELGAGGALHGHLYCSVTLHHPVLKALAEFQNAGADQPVILNCAEEVMLDCGEASSGLSGVLQQQIMRQNETRGPLITSRQNVFAVFDRWTGMSRDQLAQNVCRLQPISPEVAEALQQLPGPFEASALKWMCRGMLPQVAVDRQISLMAVNDRWEHHPLAVAAYRQAFPELQATAAEEDSSGPSF